MPTRTQVVLCWTLLAVTMTALGWILRQTVPSAMSVAYDAIGVRPVLAALFLVWCAAAWIGWGPSVRAAIARRRRASVRQ